VSTITIFEPKLVSMFCTWIPLENSIRAFQNWSFATIAISTVGVKGKGNSKGKK